MSGHVSLAELLADGKEAIASQWAKRVKTSSAKYCDRPLDDIRRDVSSLLDAMTIYLESGDAGPLDQAVADTSRRLAEKGFELSETLIAMALGLRATFDVLKDECRDRDSLECFEVADQLADLFSRASVTHAMVFEGMRRDSSVAETVSGLATTHQPMAEDSIARRSVAHIRDRFGLRAGVLLRGDEEDRFHTGEDEETAQHLKEACYRAVSEGETVMLESDGPPVSGWEAIAAVPIIARDRVVGAIAVASQDRSTLADPGTRMIRSMADHLAVSCDKARLYQSAVDMVESLDEARSELFTILSAIESPVYVSDMETYEILATNTKLEEWFGPDLVGKKCYEALQRGQAGPCPFCTNDKLLTEDGKPAPPYRWRFVNTVTGRSYNCVDKAIEWPDGRYVRLEIAHDVTELEEERLKAEQARTFLQLYNDLLLHDLGNYIGSARAYLELGLEEGDSGPRRESSFKSALAQTCRSGELIEKVRRFSKVYTSPDEARDTRDLRHVLDDSIQEVSDSFGDETPAITKSYGEGAREVKVGAFAKEIFVNLLSNAVRYGEGKEVVVSIEEGDIDGRPAWKVSVSDHGHGIPPERRDELFRRYMRLDPSKKFTDIGLGLSIAKALTDRYGGDLVVGDRVPGDHSQGAEFSVLLPRA